MSAGASPHTPLEELTALPQAPYRYLGVLLLNSTDLLTARGVAHLVVHRTSGSTSYEMTPPVRLETSGGVLSIVDMVVQRRDGRRRLREHNDDDDDF